MDEPFLGAFYEKLTRALGLFPLLTGLPHGVSAQARQTARQQFLFLMNFTNQSQTIPVEDLSDDLPPYGVRILVKDLA